MSGRPLDVLEASVGDEVAVRLKSGETYRGTLAGYDQHMNLVLDDVTSSPAGDGTTSGSETGSEGGAGAEGGSSSDTDAGSEAEEPSGIDDEAPADGRDTTIIRGDNVVSITP